MSTLRINAGIPGLTDLGLRFYTQNTPVGARISTGIVDEGGGWYSKSGLNLVGDHVRWDSPGTPDANARESLALLIAAEAVQSLVDDIAARIITDHGAGSYLATGGGSGAYLITVTVTDEADNPLENARVRLSEGINAFTVMTNASGVASFNLDAATYSLGITKAGYQFTPTSIVVTGPADFGETMGPGTATPSGQESWLAECN